MPDLDLPVSDFSRPFSEGGEAIAWRLLAYLTWPSEEKRRDEYLATLDQESASFIQGLPLPGDLQHRYPNVSESLLKLAWEESKTEAVENFVSQALIVPRRLGLVANAPDLNSQVGETGKHVTGWLTAGHILFMVYTMEKFHRSELSGGASVNKAVEFIEAKQYSGLPKNRKDIMRLWSKYQPVSHIATALLIMRPRFGEDINAMFREAFFRYPGITLSIAKVFQEFGLAFRAHGQEFPLLNATRLCTIPANYQLPQQKINFSPLPEDDLRLIKGYRAPKRL